MSKTHESSFPHYFSVCLVIAAIVFLRPAFADDTATDCDRYAASPYSKGLPAGITGVPPDKINATLAIPACEKIVAEYPENARYQFQLGRAYLIAKNYSAALATFQKAADQGFAPAEYSLGGMYQNGWGVTKDYEQAAQWCRKAADQGFVPAEGSLGDMYLTGGRGVTRDYSQATQWLRKAADQGFAPAEYNLGVMYLNGWGVTKDYEQAASWIRKAADQGFAPAEYSLGGMYQNGWGVTKDYEQAASWIRKAADQGFALAQNNLNQLTKQNQVKEQSSCDNMGSSMLPAAGDNNTTNPPVLSANEQGHFSNVLAHGEPSQLYFMALQMEQKGRPDLANQIYQKLVDQYPDDIYTAKAIEKMDHGNMQTGRNSAPNSGLSTKQIAYQKEQHNACTALCNSQSQQCNGQALGSTASSGMNAMTSIMSGDAFGMLKGLGGAAMAGATDCNTPYRACVAACPPCP